MVTEVDMFFSYSSTLCNMLLLKVGTLVHSPAWGHGAAAFSVVIGWTPTLKEEIVAIAIFDFRTYVGVQGIDRHVPIHHGYNLQGMIISHAHLKGQGAEYRSVF